jgi:hypothetical protein
LENKTDPNELDQGCTYKQMDVDVQNRRREGTETCEENHQWIDIMTVKEQIRS